MQLNIDKASQPIRLLQITDCHLGEQLLGLDTDESLIDVLGLINAKEPAPDLLLATGDIAGHADLLAYQRFLELMNSSIDAPMFWLPGNHDTPEIMNRALGGKTMPRVITICNWVVILLDSSVPGHEYGDLSDEELAFLDQTLKSHPHHHALIFLHHQPIPVGSAWVDQYIVRRAGQFFDIVDSQPQVKGICWGHVHQEFCHRRKGVTLWSTPSTCIQFKPRCEDFTVDRIMPGYRWFDLYPDGSFVSEVSRVAEKSYSIDYASSGY
ncbi:MAG: 3',5'-cyclic-AMP phosphodiesterase [Exilibacterium sp.]